MNAISHFSVAAGLVAELEALQDEAREAAKLALSDAAFDVAADAPVGLCAAETEAAAAANASGFASQVAFILSRMDQAEAEVQIRAAAKIRGAVPSLDRREFAVAQDAKAAAQQAVLAVLQQRLGGDWSPASQARFLAAVVEAVDLPLARFIAAQRPAQG